jgi:lipoprotein signal peptidase
MSRKVLIFLAILVVGVALDQFTKFLVVRELALGDQIPIIQGFFNLVLTYNKGAVHEICLGILHLHHLFGYGSGGVSVVAFTGKSRPGGGGL